MSVEREPPERDAYEKASQRADGGPFSLRLHLPWAIRGAGIVDANGASVVAATYWADDDTRRFILGHIVAAVNGATCNCDNAFSLTNCPVHGIYGWDEGVEGPL